MPPTMGVGLFHINEENKSEISNSEPNPLPRKQTKLQKEKMKEDRCKNFQLVSFSNQPNGESELIVIVTHTVPFSLQSFGFWQVRLLILPNLEEYLKLLEPEMLLEKQKNEMKRHEAWRVYGALLVSNN